MPIKGSPKTWENSKDGRLATSSRLAAERGRTNVALISWNESYSVKVKACDLQHQKLFYLINALQEAMKAGKGRQLAGDIVRDLDQYTVSHFTAEEALLERTNYPRLAEHRKQHQKFISDVKKIEGDINAGAVVSIALMDVLNDWLVNHIQVMDKAYSDHLNKAGVM